MISSELVEFLIERRHELKLTQAVLSDKIGISPAYLSDLETEKCTNPTIKTLIFWFKALNVEAKLDVSGITFIEIKKGT